jgi:OmpA-OmpF porin, OOP family
MGTFQSRSLRTFTLCCLVLLAATTAFAGDRAGAVTVTPFAGKYMFDNSTAYEDDSIIGLGLGYNLTKSLAAELSYARVNDDRLNVWGNEVKGAADLYRLEGLYSLMPDSCFVPFIAGGAGVYSLDSIPTRSGRDNDFAVDYGAGFKLFINPDVAFRADIRHLINFKGHDYDWDGNWFYTAGLTLLFGGEKPAVAAAAPVAAAPEVMPAPAVVAPAPMVKEAPKDTNGDGVTDDLDKCPDTPKGVKVDANGCPVAEKAQVTDEGALNFGIIYFDTGKYNIKPKSRQTLHEVIEYLNKNKEVKMEVQGHTDSMGSDEANMKLSDERANAVRSYLISKGIAADRLTAKGYGETKPAASNDTKEGREKNRRIEFMPIQ